MLFRLGTDTGIIACIYHIIDLINCIYLPDLVHLLFYDNQPWHRQQLTKT